MTNADWWAGVVQARTQPDDLFPQRVWEIRKDTTLARGIQAGWHFGAGASQACDSRLVRSEGRQESGPQARGNAQAALNEPTGLTFLGPLRSQVFSARPA